MKSPARMTGFSGGNSFYEVGPACDMILFYRCIDEYVVKKDKKNDYSIIIDRLYKRYLRRDEIVNALNCMKKIEGFFVAIPSKKVNWKKIGLDTNNSSLDIEKKNLADVFYNYFRVFMKAADSYLCFYREYNTGSEVRTTYTDVIWFMAMDIKPLEEYDSLEGYPFWMRDKI